MMIKILLLLRNLFQFNRMFLFGSHQIVTLRSLFKNIPIQHRNIFLSADPMDQVTIICIRKKALFSYNEERLERHEEIASVDDVSIYTSDDLASNGDCNNYLVSIRQKDAAARSNNTYTKTETTNTHIAQQGATLDDINSIHLKGLQH